MQENAYENVVCEMAAILSRPQCVNTLKLGNHAQHFADDIVSIKEIFYIWIQISLEFVTC